MKKKIACLAILVAACVPRAFAAPPSIVYVAYNGLDTHPCTRARPCRTITRALSLVAAAGAVEIVGRGTYDTFTITKAITVEAEPGAVAVIEVPSSGTGITVSAASTEVVNLRRLILNGTGGTGVGFQIGSAGRIVVEDCVSRNFAYGLGFGPVGPSDLKISGGTFEGSNTAIYIAGTGDVVAVVDAVTVYGGTYAGIEASAAKTTITHSFVTGDGARGNGILSNSGTVVLEHDVVSRWSVGVFAGFSGAVTYLSSCTITDNGEGVEASNITYSRGNNTIVANDFGNLFGTLTPFSAQ